MNRIIIGRNEEQYVLKEIANSKEPHFVALTGRRRVGKTYLIKTFFNNKIDFECSGIPNTTLQSQLQNFYYSITQSFKIRNNESSPSNWMEAFQLLSRCLSSKKKKGKIIVFIDELPWLDTHKSNFLPALDWFWNSWASDKNIMLVVCGSATSWMIHKLINNKGGLHNRITKRIHLQPFTIHETAQFLKHQKINWNPYQILQLYMALGGIPHYLKEIRKGESAMQAINRICFQKNGLLINEFDNLYTALFKNAGIHVQVIFALSSKQKGLTRNEILKAAKLTDGGSFTKILDELEWCNFISSIPSYGRIKKETLYRLTDEFSLFYIKFMYKKKNVNWQQLSATQTWKSWSGYAFENICRKHIKELKNALGISGVFTEEYALSIRGNAQQQGAQIDLMIDRKDNIINLCEVKFYDKPFIITKDYARQIQYKIDALQALAPSSKSIFPTMITTFGLVDNSYSSGFIQQSVTMDFLFSS